jgi:radical SAM protein with 4Fe4S-binding SPASM domain
MLNYIQTVSNMMFKPLTLRQTPIHLHVEHTTYCNLDCKTCNRLKYLTKPEHLSVERFKRILDQTHPKKLSLTGIGEPFMHPQVFDFIQIAKEHHCTVDIVTNGTLLTPECCDKIVKSDLDVIRISLDGASRETYQRIRGADRFFEVLDGIRSLVETKKRLNSPKPFVRLTYVMTRDNYHELARTIALGEKLGVDAANFQPLDLVGIEERKENLVGNLTYEDFSREITHALQISQYHHISTNIQHIHKNLSPYWKKFQFVEPYPSGTRICIFPWFYSYITIDGDVRPCCYLNYGQEVSMGNIFESDIQTIWNNKTYQDFRRITREGKYPHKMCRYCMARTLGDIFRDGLSYAWNLLHLC